MVAIIHKELSLPGTLHRTLRLSSVYHAAYLPVHGLLTEIDFRDLEPLDSNKLMLS